MYKKTSKFIDFMPEFPTKRTLGRFPKTNKKCTDDLNNSVETITMRKIVRL